MGGGGKETVASPRVSKYDSAVSLSAPQTSPSAPFRHRHPWLLYGAAIAAAGLVLLVGCFDAAFSTYDDLSHLKVLSEAMAAGPLGFLKPIPTWSYIPVTFLSYQFDRGVFSQLLHLNNWAAGVRFMNYVYHAIAAVLLFRFVARLGLSRGQAFVVALIFAAHPMACETVSWISERKNALAALFGFFALWVWTAWGSDLGRGRSPRWRVPLATLLYILALLSKPSALGLLPVFGLLELLPLHTPRETWAPWLTRLSRGTLRCIPLALLAGCVAALNVTTHGPELVKPPGGTVFTAMLTDLEIVSRYLFNLVAPVNLSAFYFVKPIVSLSDARVWQYGLMLSALAAGSIYLAENRARAVFGWGWFFAALGPNLNLIAIPLYMQDRYAYLSTPALFLVLIEVVAGLRTRVKLTPITLQLAAGAFVLMLAVLSVQRSFAWYNAATIFTDAVAKQPQSANARYALGMALEQAAEAEARDGHVQMAAHFEDEASSQWQAALACPDAGRFAFFVEMAQRVGSHEAERGNAAEAEKYLRLAVAPPAGVMPLLTRTELALRELIALFIAQGRYDEGMAGALRLTQIAPRSETNAVIRARAAYLLAQYKQSHGGAEDAKRLLAMARADLQAIPPASPQFETAQQFLKLLDGERKE